MSSEHRNRTNKAQAIAAALVTVGINADTVVGLTEHAWQIAALAGWHVSAAEHVDGIAKRPWTTVSTATRRQVVELLRADKQREAEDAEGLTAHRTDDVFASIAAGSALPRPVQDPDGPIMCDHVGTERVQRVAHGYLGDAPAGTVETLCAACGAEVPADLAPVVSTREWLAARNYGALPTESWE